MTAKGTTKVINAESSTVVLFIPENRSPKETVDVKRPYKITFKKVNVFFGRCHPAKEKVTMAMTDEMANLYVKNIIGEKPSRVYLITGEAIPQIAATIISAKYAFILALDILKSITAGVLFQKFQKSVKIGFFLTTGL